MSAPPASFTRLPAPAAPAAPGEPADPAFAFQAMPPPTAGLARRAAAYAVDFTVLAVLVVVLAVGAALVTVLGPGDIGPERVAQAMLPVLVLAIPIFLAYFTLLEGTWGRTLGKAALGLRVARLDGAPPTLFDSFVRNLLRLLWGPGLPSVVVLLLGNLARLGGGEEPVLDALALVALAFLLLDLGLVHASELDQRLGDMAAGTVVVEG